MLQDAQLEQLEGDWFPAWADKPHDISLSQRPVAVPEAPEKLAPIEPKAAAAHPVKEPLGPLIDHWQAGQTGIVTNELLDRQRLAFRQLGEYLTSVGASPQPWRNTPYDYTRSLSLTNISKRDASGFKEWLLQEKRIHPETVGARLSCLKSFWDWAFDSGLVDIVRPWTGIHRGLKRRAERTAKPNVDKRPFTEPELVTLLTTDPSTNRNGRWGGAIHDLLRLGLLTRARQNELASLTAGRVIKAPGKRTLWSICVTADVGKTKSAIREIPLHPVAYAIVKLRLDALPSGSGADAILFPECNRAGEITNAVTTSPRDSRRSDKLQSASRAQQTFIAPDGVSPRSWLQR
ncbi:MAG: site-specific integrase [Acetobacter sp.]|nr:site-specific integrase [Acetobacter sp.]